MIKMSPFMLIFSIVLHYTLENYWTKSKNNKEKLRFFYLYFVKFFFFITPIMINIYIFFNHPVTLPLNLT